MSDVNTLFLEAKSLRAAMVSDSERGLGKTFSNFSEIKMLFGTTSEMKSFKLE